jgi:hypothetical protein
MRLYGIGRVGLNRQAQISRRDSSFDDFQRLQKARRALFPLASNWQDRRFRETKLDGGMGLSKKHSLRVSPVLVHASF